MRPGGSTTWPCPTRSAASTPRRTWSSTSRSPPAAHAAELGELLIVESDEERLVLQATGTFRAEVEAEDDEDDDAGECASAGDWLVLATPEELVGFYDPTDVFGDLADALAEAFPAVAPEVTGDGGDADQRPDDPSTTARPARTTDRG